MATSSPLTLALEQLVARSADPAFRELCLTDAPRAWQEATGAPLPPGLRLRILASGLTELVVLLPDQAREEDELSFLQLDGISGGKRAEEHYQFKF